MSTLHRSMNLSGKRLLRTAALTAALGWGIAAAQASDLVEDTALAVQNGDTATIQKLLAKGIDPNTTDEKGNPLLNLAAANGDEAMVDLLLRSGASPNRRNLVGETPAMMAALKGHAKVLQRLIDAGAIVDHAGWTPLHYAALQGNLECVDVLLRAKVDVNAAAPNGSTALMLAARNGHVDVVKRLLAAGADTEKLNEEGRTAVSWALEKQQTETADLIEKARRAKGLPPTKVQLVIE